MSQLGWAGEAGSGPQSGGNQAFVQNTSSVPPSTQGEGSSSQGALPMEHIMKIAKTLEAMKASGYDTSDARYLTLLQILKKHTQQQGDFGSRSQLSSSTPSSQPFAAANGGSSGSTSHANGGQSYTQSRPFTQEQLIQLRAQILAYKYLSRNIPLPPNILQGIRGSQVPRTNPQTPGSGRPDRLARLSTPARPGMPSPYSGVGMPAVVGQPGGTPNYAVTAQKDSRMRVKRQTPSSPQMPGMPEPYTQQPKLSPKFLAQERDKRILSRMLRRLDELKALPAELPPDLQLRAKIEEKQLHLLPLQKKLRQKIVQEIHQETSLQVAEDQGAYRRQSRKHLKQITTSSEKQKEREETKKKKRQMEFANAVVSHVKTFKDFHGSLSSRWKKINRGIANAYANRMKRKQAREEREERERLALLRENDEEGYLRLLEKTKNKRLAELLNQTNEYLKNIGVLVARHQEEEEEEEKRWRHEAEQKMLAEKGKEKEGEGDASAEGESKEKQEGADDPTKGQKVTTYYTMAHSVEEEITKQPDLLTGGALKHYQMIGLQWLVSLYNNKLNGILADEMGLGKTIQTIALICYLMESKGNNGPYLIVVPLSTLSNWDLEFEKWAPGIKRVVYKGTPPRRKSIWTTQLQHGKFNVLLTTYEYVIKDKASLAKLRWNYIIIDEGHRMKNHSCKLASVFGHHYKSRHRLLLTGTPLQNSLPELWSLLNFLLPSIFNSVENFEEWFNAPFAAAGDRVEMTEEETWIIINRLHKVLRPFLLRRLKKNVEDQLPDKVEKVLKCGFSAWQKRMYEQMREQGVIRVENPKDGKQNVKGLMNTLMQLRKICNHPYLFNEQGDWEVDLNIVRAAGKFDLLDHVLPKLKATGHKVLIFSQMTQLITILEDYFRWKGFTYLRLDGSTKAEDRADLLRLFNAKDSPYFIFVLSTRAGGLGLNLQSADTVILFDSDWNPHIDMQAQDRAHRIGQTREVRVFRLCTVNSIEENILARASFKMGLDAKIIEAGMFNKKSNAEQRKHMLEDLLRKDQEKKDLGDELPSDAEINQMLARTDEEFEIFQQMDAEREKALLVEWKRMGKKGTPPRLMQEDELPDWMLAEQIFPDEAQTYGRGLRERKEVFYDDLTESQWDKILEEGGDEEDIANLREANKKRRTKRASKVAEEGNDEEEEDDEEEEQPRKKRRRKAEKEVEEEEKSSPKEKEPRMRAKRKAAMKSKPEEEKAKPTRKRAKKAEVSPEQEELNAKYLEIWNTLRHSEEAESGRIRSEIFLVKPSRRIYPDYYLIIKSPIDMKTIKKSIETSKYTNKEDFKKDVLLLFQNAQEYNTPESLIFEDAVFLQNLFLEEFAKKFAS